MSDSNIYMASTQSLCFPLSDPLAREGEAVKGKSSGGQRGTEGGICSKTEGGVLVMPSVLITTSGLDGVLHPVHL